MHKKKDVRNNKSVPTKYRRTKTWTKIIVIQTIVQAKMQTTAQAKMQTTTQTKMQTTAQAKTQTTAQAKTQTTTTKNKKGTFFEVPFLLYKKLRFL